jgi:membrane associated rhomboid family serine protease
MDRATSGLRFDGAPVSLPPDFDPASGAGLSRDAAIAVLTRADDLFAENEPDQALPLYAAATASQDREVAAAAFYGRGNVLYRIDRDVEARESWEKATTYGETPVAYRAWRQVAAARVREGNLPGALDAYRQCEKRAPKQDRGEIASRLGWLNKETGNTGAAQKYFARSRGDALPPFMTYIIIAVTAVTSYMAMSGPNVPGTHFTNLELQLEMNSAAIAHGELWRLLTVTLVHDPANILHLLFNMYALWYAGQLVERMYGSALMLAFYALCGIAGATASFAFGSSAASVGASGAIFGLFGVILVATRFHHTVLDAQSRAIASQVGVLIVLNLVIGFSGFLNIDNFAHVGGLAAGLWLSFLIPPGQVPTLASLWRSPKEGSTAVGTLVPRVLGVGVLAAVIVAGVLIGTGRWQQDPYYKAKYGGAPAVPAGQFEVGRQATSDTDPVLVVE